MSILVVDVGTSGVRAAIVRPDATVEHVHYRELLPVVAFARASSSSTPRRWPPPRSTVATAALADGGPVEAVGIANQRASTIVWDAATGEPVGAGRRLAGPAHRRRCASCSQAEGIRFAPNASATKLAFLLDMADPDRTRDDLCFGTVDTWIAWTCPTGRVHVTDQSNAGVTGLRARRRQRMGRARARRRSVSPAASCRRSSTRRAIVGEATALPGAPPIAGIAGDQQASLIGQGCVRPGLAKITFGTGGMLDLCLGSERPAFERRGEGGTFPIVAWRRDGAITWGVEAIMLSAGTNVEWLRDDLGLIETAARVARRRVAVHGHRRRRVRPRPPRPRHAGLGLRRSRHAARAHPRHRPRRTSCGPCSRASPTAAPTSSRRPRPTAGLAIAALRVDGGMSANPTFVAGAGRRQPAAGRGLARCVEATTLGAAFLAGLAVGTWEGMDDIAGTWRPRTVIEPSGKLDRARWLDARTRAEGWVAELSALDF